MSSKSAEFLTELSEVDSLTALRAAHSQQSALIFKVDSYPNPIKTTIDNFLDKRAILPSDLKDLKLPADKEISIKFNVGTEVFFIKTFIKSHMNRYYFDMSSKVIKLKGRREPRHLVPKKWSQTAGIFVNTTSQDLLKCTVVDISLSGIRLDIGTAQLASDYQRDDIIKIKFQIHKRAEIITLAIVRFNLSKTNIPPIIGLEFAEMSDVQKERIANLIQDISLFNSAARH